MDRLPLSSTAVDIRCYRSHPLVPPYPNILHYLIKFFHDPPVPLPLLRVLYRLHPYSCPCPLAPLPYPLDIRGEPKYLVLGGRKGGPGCTRLILSPIQILPHIVNFLAYPSNGLGTGITLYIHCLSHHTLRLVRLIYDQFYPFPGIVPLPLGRPHPLPTTPQ